MNGGGELDIADSDTLEELVSWCKSPVNRAQIRDITSTTSHPRAYVELLISRLQAESIPFLDIRSVTAEQEYHEKGWSSLFQVAFLHQKSSVLATVSKLPGVRCITYWESEVFEFPGETLQHHQMFKAESLTPYKVYHSIVGTLSKHICVSSTSRNVRSKSVHIAVNFDSTCHTREPGDSIDRVTDTNAPPTMSFFGPSSDGLLAGYANAFNLFLLPSTLVCPSSKWATSNFMNQRVSVGPDKKVRTGLTLTWNILVMSLFIVCLIRQGKSGHFELTGLIGSGKTVAILLAAWYLRCLSLFDDTSLIPVYVPDVNTWLESGNKYFVSCLRDATLGTVAEGIVKQIHGDSCTEDILKVTSQLASFKKIKLVFLLDQTNSFEDRNYHSLSYSTNVHLIEANRPSVWAVYKAVAMDPKSFLCITCRSASIKKASQYYISPSVRIYSKACMTPVERTLFKQLFQKEMRGVAFDEGNPLELCSLINGSSHEVGHAHDLFISNLSEDEKQQSGNLMLNYFLHTPGVEFYRRYIDGSSPFDNRYISISPVPPSLPSKEFVTISDLENSFIFPKTNDFSIQFLPLALSAETHSILQEKYFDAIVRSDQYCAGNLAKARKTLSNLKESAADAHGNILQVFFGQLLLSQKHWTFKLRRVFGKCSQVMEFPVVGNIDIHRQYCAQDLASARDSVVYTFISNNRAFDFFSRPFAYTLGKSRHENVPASIFFQVTLQKSELKAKFDKNYRGCKEAARMADMDEWLFVFVLPSTDHKLPFTQADLKKYPNAWLLFLNEQDGMSKLTYPNVNYPLVRLFLKWLQNRKDAVVMSLPPVPDPTVSDPKTIVPR